MSNEKGCTFAKRNNKLTLHPEGAATEVPSLKKSSYIRNEEKLYNGRGTLNYTAIIYTATLAVGWSHMAPLLGWTGVVAVIKKEGIKDVLLSPMRVGDFRKNQEIQDIVISAVRKMKEIVSEYKSNNSMNESLDKEITEKK